jgi:hypothetical protein
MLILISRKCNAGASHKCVILCTYEITEGKPDKSLIRKISFIAILCHTCREKQYILKTCLRYYTASTGADYIQVS